MEIENTKFSQRSKRQKEHHRNQKPSKLVHSRTMWWRKKEIPDNSKPDAATAADEASPLLLHHQLTAGAGSSTSTSGSNNDASISSAANSNAVSTPKNASSTTDLKSKSALVALVSASSVGDTTSSSSSSSSHETDHPFSKSAKTDTANNNLWTRYQQSVERNPFLVKSITAFFILALGDICGQGVEHWMAGISSSGSNGSTSIHTSTMTTAGVDWIRTARFGLFGLFGAPSAHLYFYYLDAFLPPTPDQPCSGTTLVKLAIDQGIQAPAALALMVAVLAILKGTGWTGVVTDMHDNYWNALLANCKCCTAEFHCCRALVSHGPANRKNCSLFVTTQGKFGYQPLSSILPLSNQHYVSSM